MSIGEDSVRPSGAGLRNVHFLIMHTSIGYKLLTVSFGEYMSAGRFLCRGRGPCGGRSGHRRGPPVRQVCDKVMISKTLSPFLMILSQFWRLGSIFKP